MISVAALIAFCLGFVYVDWQVNQNYWQARTCSDYVLLKGPNLPSTAAGVIVLAFFIALFGWGFWGATDNPYHRSGNWFIHAGDDYAIYLLLILGFCIGSSAYVCFKWGQVASTLELRKEMMDPATRYELERRIAEEQLAILERGRADRPGKP